MLKVIKYTFDFINDHIIERAILKTVSLDAIFLFQLLIEITHEIGQQTADGSTALHLACQYGRIARLKALIGKGIPVNAVTNQGATALHIASRYGHELIVKHLLSAGADASLYLFSDHLFHSLETFIFTTEKYLSGARSTIMEIVTPGYTYINIFSINFQENQIWFNCSAFCCISRLCGRCTNAL